MSFAALAVFLALGALARAQSTSAVCTYAEWTLNSKDESACLVWAKLQTICKTSGVTVGPVTNATAPYPPPSGSTATDCNCNVVAYNLMGGCSWCQPNIYSYDWVSENEWSAGCSSFNSQGLPSSIQSAAASLAIPDWAFLVPDGLAWSAGDAEDVAEGSASVTVSGVASATARTTSSATAVTGPLSGDDGPYSSGDDNFDDGVVKNVGVILGVVLGLVFGIPAIGSLIALIVFCNRENKRKKFYGPLAEYYRNGGAPPPELMTQAAPMGAGGMMYAPQPGYPQQVVYPQQPGHPQQPQAGFYAGPSTVGSPSPAPATVGTSSPVASPQQAYIQPASPSVQQQQPWNPFHQMTQQPQPQFPQHPGTEGSAPPAPPPGAYQPGIPMV